MYSYASVGSNATSWCLDVGCRCGGRRDRYKDVRYFLNCLQNRARRGRSHSKRLQTHIEWLAEPSSQNLCVSFDEKPTEPLRLVRRRCEPSAGELPLLIDSRAIIVAGVSISASVASSFVTSALSIDELDRREVRAGMSLRKGVL